MKPLLSDLTEASNKSFILNWLHNKEDVAWKGSDNTLSNGASLRRLEIQKVADFYKIFEDAKSLHAFCMESAELRSCATV